MSRPFSRWPLAETAVLPPMELAPRLIAWAKLLSQSQERQAQDDSASLRKAVVVLITLIVATTLAVVTWL